MRLLQIAGEPWSDDPLDIALCDFLGVDIPEYMILSHRWREEEILYTDMIGPDRTIAQAKYGYKKLETSCRIALQQGLSYAWIDTCCIDKSSSAELSEAINSMYSYYANAQVCYAFLDDVDHVRLADEKSLKDSKWFHRGWTLQELIAPSDLYFYSSSWKPMGSKASLCRHISFASGVDQMILRDPGKLGQICVSEKMSWAAKRSTTRPEDEAYCLMGLFGVNLPPLYGEGRQKAFRRLQLEIMQTTADHTLFAWHSNKATGDMLAPTVAHFMNGSTFERVGFEDLLVNEYMKPDFNMTNFGLHIQLPLWKVTSNNERNLYFALFACKTKGASWYAGTYLRETKSGRIRRFHRDAFDGSTVSLFPAPTSINLVRMPLESIWISNADPSLETRRMPPSNFPDLEYVHFFVKSGCPKRFAQTQWHSAKETFSKKWNISRYELELAGSFDIGKTRHEVVAIIGNRPVNFVFGILQGQLWFHLALANDNLSREDAYEELFAAYHYPTGKFWQRTQHDPPIFVERGCMSYDMYEDKNSAGVRLHISFSMGERATAGIDPNGIGIWVAYNNSTSPGLVADKWR